MQSGILDFNKLQQVLQASNNVIGKSGQYLSRFDTLKTSLNFLSTNIDVISGDKIMLKSQLAEASKSMTRLGDKLRQATAVEDFIKGRKQLLKSQFETVGMVRALRKFNKQAYYYSAQMKEYRALIEDPDRVEQKAIEVLKKLPQFQRFIRNHSELAALFPATRDYDSVQSFEGLQTRADIKAVIQEQLEAAGPEAANIALNNIQQARQMMDKIKNELARMQGVNSNVQSLDEEFRPNNMKTKSLLKRLELGMNLQSVKANNFFPNTTDLGLSVGYKLNDKSIVGVGMAYRFGLGNDFRNIDLSHQGMSLRSFLNYKVKGSFFITGGAEMNYRSEFKNFPILKDYSAWQKSALFGFGKCYQMGRKWRGNIQLLYDFMYKRQIPQTQAIIFRTYWTR